MARSWPYNVEGFRRAARKRLPKPVFDFVDGGAEDEETLRANRAQFQEFRFLPKLFIDVANRDLSTKVAGVQLRLPIMFAPTGLVGLIHPDGEKAAAVVASREGLIAVVSGHATYSMEEVAKASGPGQWFDMFPWKDRGFYGSMMERAATAGYKGLCLTVDTTVGSNRERDWANGWVAPPRLTANAFEYGRHPIWVIRTLRHRRGTLRNFNPDPPSLRTFIRRASASAATTVGFINQSMTWNDFEWIRDHWSGPLSVKGAFTVADATRLADCGVNVLFVGNHGGRQLDGLQTGLEQLPQLVQAIGGRVDLVLDGGVRRGSDIVKAICLGAKACMIGRPWVYALGAGGTDAVRAMIKVLERELDMTMALLGAQSITDLGPSFLQRSKFPDGVLGDRNGSPKNRPRDLERRQAADVGKLADHDQ